MATRQKKYFVGFLTPQLYLAWFVQYSDSIMLGSQAAWMTDAMTHTPVLLAIPCLSDQRPFQAGAWTVSQSVPAGDGPKYFKLCASDLLVQ